MKKLAVICCAAVAALGSFSVFGAAVVPENFTKKISISLSDAEKATLGEESLTDFPIPVRLSTDITHFSYSDFRFAGEDIAFADKDGNALEFELDTWNTDGESLYWVKIPSLTASTTLTCYYGASSATVHDPKLVWTSYAAVIHGGQSLKDSSTNQLAVTANATTLTDSAVVGGGIAKAANNSIGVNLANPYNALTAYNKFSVLGWFKRDGNGGKDNGTHILAAARTSFGVAGGFMILQETGKYISVAAQSSHQWSSGNYKLDDKVWAHFAFTYENGGKLISYFNGAKDQEKSSPDKLYATISEAANWTFGSCANTATQDSFKGEMDELRVYDGVASALWVTNEYAFAADASRIVAGSAEPVDPDAVILAEGTPTMEKTADGFRMTAALDAKSPTADLLAIYGDVYPFAQTNLIASAVAGGASASGVLTSSPTNAMCAFGVYAVNSSVPGKTAEKLSTVRFLNGVVTIVKTRDADESALGTPGQFTVSRPATATDGDLVVSYSVGGTAVAGTHYVALPGSVTIPDGESSAIIDVYAKVAGADDHTLTLTLGSGLFLTEPATSAATLTIVAFDPSAGFDKKIEYTLSDYSGSALTDFPMLIRLSPTNTTDFTYSDFKLANGGDLRFTTEFGAPLTHEIEVWNPDGDSLVWVKIPAFEKDTKIIAYYGNSHPWSVDHAATWSDYAGVWHLDEETAGTTTVVDATGNQDGTTHTKSLVTDGVIGKARGRTDATAKNGATLTVPKYSALDALVPTFTVSGWMKPTESNGSWSYVYSRKDADSYPSWGWQFRASENKNSVGIYSSGNADSDSQRNVFGTTGKFPVNTWTKFDVVYEETQVSLYVNGAKIGTQTIKPTGGAKNGSLDFTIGGLNGSGHGTMKSYFDEFRLRSGTVSDDWVAAEYDVQRGALTMANDGAKPVDATAVKFEGKPSVSKSGTNFKIGVELAADSGTGRIDAVYGTNDAYDLTNLVESAGIAGGVYEGTLTHLPTNTSCKVEAVGLNDKGTITISMADETVYYGVPMLTKTRDAAEASLSVPALVTVTRADSYGDLVVNYTTGGDAVAGTHYVELPGTITITNGATTATIEVYPLRTKTTDHTLTITLDDGLYLLDGASASVTIKKFEVPTGFNTWIADADGNASDAANWSENRVPLSTDNILVDGRYSNASMTWDAGVNGLPSSVASWTQSYVEGEDEYTGTVTFPTVYPGKGDFTCFTVDGACVIQAGMWTHPLSRTMGAVHDNNWDWVGDLKANETYRIRLNCGSLSVGAKGKIDVQSKGYCATADGTRIMTAAHGGMMSTSGAQAYDDPKEPIHIGMSLHASSGYWQGWGGGAIYIVVDGNAVVDGWIGADSGRTGMGGGAAGSVYLKANAVTGTGSITAEGSPTQEGNYKGVGGRVAIITETPVNRATFAKISAAAEWKNAQGGQATIFGGCGTVFFKDSTRPNGLLVVGGKSDWPSLSWGYRYRVTDLGTEGDWTFDAVELGRGGRLIIRPGTALHLPNGLNSVSSTSDSALHAGIRFEGGTLDIGSNANQTMSGNWMLTGWTNCVLNCNLTVQNGAMLGVHGIGEVLEEGATLTSYLSSSVEVRGDLTIASGSQVRAMSGGMYKSKNSEQKGVLPYAAHGGRTVKYGNDAYHNKSFDSVFAPFLPGVSCPEPNGQGRSVSGSATRLLVSGHLTLNGSVNANGSPESYNQGGNCGSGHGGAIDITAGSISGNGAISANGGSFAWHRGAGGRIAIKLTDANADFSNYTGSIFASGRRRDGTTTDSSAGTVYLETAADGVKGGMVKIAMMSDSQGYATNTTEMASLGYGGDAVADYKRVNYVVSLSGRAAVNTNMTVKSMTLADTTAYLDLEGNTLTLSKFTYVTASVTNTLSNGTYTYADLSAITGLNVYDTSDGHLGKIIVSPIRRGLKVVLR